MNRSRFLITIKDSEFDHMLASVPESLLDSRRYHLPNFNEELLVHHHRHKFVYSSTASNIAI